MQTSRRSCVRGLAAAGVAIPAFPAFRGDAFARLFRANAIAGGRAPGAVAEDELYWSEIQRAFDADRTTINYTSVEEIDTFTDAVLTAIKSGIAS